MNIEITIANEAKLVSEFKASLQREARRAVQDSNERVGKQYALVTLPEVDIHWLYPAEMTLKVEFV